MKVNLTWLCLCTLVMAVGCSSHQPEHREEQTFLVTSPIIKDTTILKDYVCQIRSINHIELRTQERGYLQQIFADEGRYVQKGQLLFKVMPVLYQAEKEKAQANLNYAEIEYLNTKRLADSNIVSANELALAKARLDKEKADLALASAHLNFTDIRAPFSGILDKFNVRLGSLLEEGELLTTLSDNSKMWVYFNVPEAEYLDYITKPKAEQVSKVTLQMSNQVMYDQPGVIETIEADFNNETGNIAFRATFPNPNQILRHGQTGSILMPISLKNAMLIPQQATYEVLDKKFVFVVDKDSTVKARQIDVGVELPHLYVVTNGLQVGDKILLDGLRKVKNGQKIKFAFEDQQKVWDDLTHLHAE